MALEDQFKDYGYGPSDDFINDQTEQGQKTYEKQRYGRPRFSFPDISNDEVDRNRLLNVLLGGSAGIQASASGASPLASFALGLGGGIQSVRQHQAAQEAARFQRAQQEQTLTLGEGRIAEQQLDATPLGQISPNMAAKLKEQYGMDVADMPLGRFKQISPLLQTQVKADEARKMFAANAGLRKDLANSSPAIQALFELQNNLPPGTLRSMKTAELGALKEGAAKPLSAELLKLKENAQDGITSISNALDIYKKSPQSVKLLGTYKGFGADVLRTASPEAQEFARSVDKTTDVVTRIRTGAALNAKEQEFYTGLVTKITQSNGQNIKAMEELLKFYEKINADIDAGRRTSSLSALASDPKKLADLMRRLKIDPKTVDAGALFAPSAPKTFSQTATNPQTGQKIGLNAQSQWEVIE